MRALSLLERYVELHNQGRHSRDFGPMLSLFAEDAEFLFTKIALGPFMGKESIAAAFREMPPDDDLVIRRAAQDEPRRASVTYSWAQAPRVVAGSLVAECANDKLRKLVVC